MKISLAQTNITYRDTKANFNKAALIVKTAADSGSNLIVFPELWTSGYDLPNCDNYYRENQTILRSLILLASEYHISIGGSYIYQHDYGFTNTFILINNKGTSLPTYNKTHLFGLMQEDIYFIPGDHLQVVNISGCNTGLSICYDLRFPEIFTAYSVKGCELILMSAEWPYSRISHWKALLIARAIETQTFIAATNAVGRTGDEIYGGTSMLVSPLGEILSCGNSQTEELLSTEIDLSEVAKVRIRLPVSLDRRPDLYMNL